MSGANPVILTVPDYTNTALANPNVAGSIADQLIDVIPTAIAALPTDADVNTEVDTALNTAIPASNTADSVNDILLDQIKPRLPGSGTIATTADLISAGTIDFNATAKASINAEVDTALNTAITSAPTEKSLNDILHKDGSFTFDNTTDSLEAIADTLAVKGTQAYTTGSGNWTCPASVYFVDVLIVGGGGNGVSGNTGAGGGGEVVSLNKYPVTPTQNYAYVVGAATQQSSFDGVIAAPGVTGSTTSGGAGGGAYTDAAGGAAGAKGLASGGSRISRYGGGGGGNGAASGGASYFAAGGTTDASNGGGGGSFKAGAAPGANPVANGGGGGAGDAGTLGYFTGATGYVLISWGY